MHVFHEADLARLRVFGIKRAAGRLMSSRLLNPLLRRLARRFPPATRLRLPLAQKRVEYRQTAGRVTLLNPAADMVARDVYWGDGKPQNAADARTLRCIEALCSGGGTFYDVGSYSGLFALVAASAAPSLRAVAFEILPENYLLISRNIIENDAIGRVEARLCGLADRSGRIRVPSHLDLASLASSVSIGSTFSSGVSVPISTLDEVSAGHGGPFTIKIDVEGFELQVLAGGVRLIAEHRPDMICELLPGAEAGAIQEMLEPLGYRFFRSAAGGFIEAKDIRPDPEARDWLFSARGEIGGLISSLD